MKRLHLSFDNRLGSVTCGLLLVFLVIALQTMPMAAAPCQVPSSAYPTIQAAVDDATCATINVAAGTYHERVMINRSVTIRGGGQETTVVDGGGSGPVFTITGGTVTIKGVTIQHGQVGLGGGGIFNRGTLTVQNSTFSENQGDYAGGGIFNESPGTVTLTHVSFQNNTPNDCTGCSYM
jgi:nitrous oxidase accessory protein NosD